ncbi:coenzyme F390 synthetase [Pelotomaculum thermopropionicum SI]|uniref:Coenzyme F390 synthetase n=1 Tax=Pelotomaculum thermopropionicum (strain DSM 13744 / JCM 10971 / SI) TaxID=370438 RepID=A5D5B3_PELTS|nr:coenzyme F390 synthetase [Pelotomaculum thermopropionicum SI]
MNKRIMNFYYKCPRFLQTLGINIFETREKLLRSSRSFRKWLRLLIEKEKWSKKDIEEYQNKHLREILLYAYHNVPFYYDLYNKHKIDVSKINNVKDLSYLPIISRNDIIKAGELIKSIRPGKYIIRHTSGTIGQPLEIRCSYNLAILNKANAYLRDQWAGYRGQRVARFVGDTPIGDCNDPFLYRLSYIMNRAIYPSYCLSFNNLSCILESMRMLNVKLIQCYPSTGYMIAKFLEMNNSYFPLDAILYSSEPMYDYQREVIEERFKAKVFGYYGQAEGVISACECEEGQYHLTMVDGIMEIIKDNKKVPDGEKGFTVVTSLHNFAMPLIRYALNDYTGYKLEKCKCGRNTPIIYPVETKVEDFLITPDGRIISPSLLTFPLKHAKNIVESQIIQTTPKDIIIKIVRGKNFNKKDEEMLLLAFKEIVGRNIEIKIMYTEYIHQTSAYKKRFVINELGRDCIEKTINTGN